MLPCAAPAGTEAIPWGTNDDGFVTLIRISPKDFDPPNSRWNGYGPAYEGNPAIARMGATYTHAFGSQWGCLRYRVTVPDMPILAADISARLSSEFPGYRGPPLGTSEVTLFVNGQKLSTVEVIADNGSGKDYTWEIPNHALKCGGNNIEFWVLESAKHRNGLCIYDKGLVPGEVDSPIRLRIWNKPT